jgi:hypothetical protein
MRSHTEYERDHAHVNANASRGDLSLTNIFFKLYGGYFLINSEANIHANLFHEFRNDVVASFGISSQGRQGGLSSLDQSGWPSSHISTFDDVAFPISINQNCDPN